MAALLFLGPWALFAGDYGASLSASNVIMPGDGKDIDILSMDLDIRLPKPGERGITLQTEYEIRNEGNHVGHMRVLLPLYQWISPAKRPLVCLEPIVELDGVRLHCQHLDFFDLAEPYLQQWKRRAWQVLDESDSSLRPRIEAVLAATGSTRKQKWQTLDAYIKAHPKLCAQARGHIPCPPSAAIEYLVKLLLDPDREETAWVPRYYQSKIEDAMQVIDFEQRQEYNLDRLLPPALGLDELQWVRDPYEGCLCGWGRPKAYKVRALQFNLPLLSHHTHHLAVSYIQTVGYDERDRVPGRRRFSLQFCYLFSNATKWHSWGNTNITIRWPFGLRQIKFGDTSQLEAHYSRRDGYHALSYTVAQPNGDLYVGWIP